MLSTSARVVVIGGGVLGCATAFWLARSGQPVTLLEPDAWGDHASGKNAGNLNPFLGAPPSLIPLALESFRLHRALTDELTELGCTGVGLAPVKRILLAFDNAEAEKLALTAELINANEGFAAQILSAKEIYEREPRVGPGVCAGLLITGNLSVDGRALTAAFANAAVQHGAIVVRERALDLENNASRVHTVRTVNQRITCHAVVLATGAWIADTQRWLGVTLPVEPVRGQLLRVRLPGAGLGYDLTHHHISLYRRGTDEVWLGVTREMVGLDETPTPSAREYLLSGCVRLLPDVTRAEVLEHCASLRPQGPDGLPLIGSLPGWENVYVANGGGIKGVLLSTGIAQALHDLMRHGHTTMPIDSLNHWRTGFAQAMC